MTWQDFFRNYHNSELRVACYQDEIPKNINVEDMYQAFRDRMRATEKTVKYPEPEGIVTYPMTFTEAVRAAEGIQDTMPRSILLSVQKDSKGCWQARFDCEREKVIRIPLNLRENV